ncbi:MAG TPA: hypothetical protein VHV75_02270 [Solirubrobacteraceae bacterium]|nr:hypothetical protein [Solirubrobacteraceae bacterium]
MNFTVAPESEHTSVADGSTVNVTGRPELAVADTVYVLPYVGDVGAVDVNVICWSATAALADDRPMPPANITITTADVAIQVRQHGATELQTYVALLAGAVG